MGTIAEAEECGIEAVHGVADGVLHLDLDAEDPERFHQQVEK